VSKTAKTPVNGCLLQHELSGSKIVPDEKRSFRRNFRIFLHPTAPVIGVKFGAEYHFQVGTVVQPPPRFKGRIGETARSFPHNRVAATFTDVDGVTIDRTLLRRSP
jgi:hypothetical protein